MNKFEKLIEYIINEDEAKAKALFHKIVVEKSRKIYEGLVEDDFPVEQGDGADSFGDEISDHEDVIDGDEEGMDDDMGGDEDFGGDDEMGGMDDEMGGEDEGGLEDRVMDLEDAIDELKSEFDRLMGDDEEGGDDFGGEEDFGGDEGGDDFGGDDEEGSDFDSDEGDDMGGDELGDEVGGDDKKFGEASIYGESKKTDKPWKDSKGKEHSGTAVKGDKYTGKEAAKEANSAEDKKDKKKAKNESKTPNDLMREYIEKVGQNWPNGASEGDAVGSGGTKSPINSKSIQINGKNDMGGTTANIARGGTASDKDSNTGPKKPSNAYTKGEKKMGQDKYENSPAANTKGYKDKRTVKREQEGQTTDGSVPVDKKSFNPGGTPGYKG